MVPLDIPISGIFLLLNWSAQVYTLQLNSVSKGPFNGNRYWDVYADFNRDGDFSDASELVGTKITLQTSATFGLSVPPNAVPGLTTMRIVLSRNQQSNDCNLSGYGEIEDYALYIKQVSSDSLLRVQNPDDRGLAQTTRT